ncbi:hypothetical protein [Actinotalea solisilvae]|uniref:hypothetical protein n=1 Tax=Actinotalea solisilvae TaxID=2072922 RepID=UPI0018F23B96|nr:hypothetical protein [Actinotalea solisilvae]
MLLLDALAYDPSTTVLTATYATPSRTRWAAYEYRGVSPELYERVRCAGLRRKQVIAEQVAPDHAWRRVGSGGWHAPTETVPDVAPEVPGRSVVAARS